MSYNRFRVVKMVNGWLFNLEEVNTFILRGDVYRPIKTFITDRVSFAGDASKYLKLATFDGVAYWWQSDSFNIELKLEMRMEQESPRHKLPIRMTLWDTENERTMETGLIEKDSLFALLSVLNDSDIKSIKQTSADSKNTNQYNVAKVIMRNYE